jgi:hypothetical protein
MGARGETLARQLEAKASEAVAVLERLTDEEWKKVTRAERWPVGVTAHHLATAFGAVPDVVAAIASGQLRGDFTRATLDEMNARHAKEHAGCDKAETIALFKKGAATAATTVRGLSDDQLTKSGTVFTDAAPMTAEQLVVAALIAHVDEHVGSIRKAVGT